VSPDEDRRVEGLEHARRKATSRAGGVADGRSDPRGARQDRRIGFRRDEGRGVRLPMAQRRSRPGPQCRRDDEEQAVLEPRDSDAQSIGGIPNTTAYRLGHQAPRRDDPEVTGGRAAPTPHTARPVIARLSCSFAAPGVAAAQEGWREAAKPFMTCLSGRYGLRLGAMS
jgi:hypothetical protein